MSQAPETPLAAEPDAEDLALLGKVGAALSTERNSIAADRAAFKAKLRARMAAEPATSSVRRPGSSRVTKAIRPRSWVRNLRYYAAAMVMIGLTLGLLAMSGLLSQPNLSGRPQDLQTARLTAEPIPIGMSGDDLKPGELFKPFDNQKMLLIIDTSGSEACLALIPQAVIDQEYSAAEKTALTNRPHWDVTVEQGRINLPVEAYTKALGASRTQLMLLKIAGHYEIWTADALRRYRENKGGRQGSRPQGAELIEG